MEELPELNRKQVYKTKNVSLYDGTELNKEPAGEVKLEYTCCLAHFYNKMKITPDLFAPKVSSIIEGLMTRFSRWELIKKVLARLLYF